MAPRTLRNGRYTLNRVIGEGSQAETFEARDNGVSPTRPAPGQLKNDWERFVARSQRGDAPNPVGLVAIKSFHVGRAKAWKDVELAEREARTLASLSHPNLPRYIEHFEEDGALYLVMEMVEGESLASIRKAQRTTSTAEVTRMLTDIGDALRYLHGRAPAVVHRDIKPGNVLRRHDGSYALVDFGAVRDRLKPEGGSTVVGTFGYMAPEQFQGRASPKSDLYGLAATALVMLTGTEPEDLPHVGLGIDVAKALPSNTPAALVRALSSMLDPDPDRRVSSIDEALAPLRARSVEAPPPKKAAPSMPPPFLPATTGVRGDRRDTRRERRRAREAEKQLARAERRRLRGLRRSRAVPLLVRFTAVIGLLAARGAVALTVGLIVPLALVLLSLVFGGALRRAAVATRNAASRVDESLERSIGWLSGHRDGDTVNAMTPEQLRVTDDADRRVRVRVHDAELHESPRNEGDYDAEFEEERDERHEAEPQQARRRRS